MDPKKKVKLNNKAILLNMLWAITVVHFSINDARIIFFINK